jgi:hypothetical protein
VNSAEKPEAERFQNSTTCPLCRGFRDAKPFLAEIVAQAREFALPPDQIERALAPLIAAWTAAAARCAASGHADMAPAIEIMTSIVSAIDCALGQVSYH